MRHLISGIDCAIAGAAIAVEAASPTPADFRNWRRFIAFPLCESTLCRRDRSGLNRRFFLAVTGERLTANLTKLLADAKRKNPGPQAPGAVISSLRTRSGARTRPDHEGVEGVFGHL